MLVDQVRHRSKGDLAHETAVDDTLVQPENCETDIMPGFLSARCCRKGDLRQSVATFFARSQFQSAPNSDRTTKRPITHSKHSKKNKRRIEPRKLRGRSRLCSFALPRLPPRGYMLSFVVAVELFVLVFTRDGVVIAFFVAGHTSLTNTSARCRACCNM